MIFHSFLYVYQRVSPTIHSFRWIKTRCCNAPPSCPPGYSLCDEDELNWRNHPPAIFSVGENQGETHRVSWIFPWGNRGFCWNVFPEFYHLVNVYITNYGKSPFFMGKLTISMAIFNSYVSLPEGIRPKMKVNPCTFTTHWWLCWSPKAVWTAEKWFKSDHDAIVYGEFI